MYVCMWTGILEYNSFCCYGHYEDSRLLNALSGQKFDFYGPTNAEVGTLSDLTQSNPDLT